MIPYIIPKSTREPNIFWLACYPKSGSTWMRAFISAYLGDGNVDINNLAGMGDNRPELYQAVSPIPLDELGQLETTYLRPAMLFDVLCSGQDTLMKTHCCNGMIWGIPAIPPEMSKGAVYVVRDPRDVCISYSHHMGLTIDKSIDAMNSEENTIHTGTLSHHLSTWSYHVMSWLEKPGFTTGYVRYEDMLEKPQDSFGWVAKFMTGKDVDKEKLEKSLDACKFQNLKRQEQEKGFEEKSPKTDSFFRKGKSSWREILSPEQVGRIEADHGEVMKKFGYL